MDILIRPRTDKWQTRPLIREGAPNEQSQSHIATDGQSVGKSWCRAPSGTHDRIFMNCLAFTVLFCGAPSLTSGRVCLFICCWHLPVQSFSVLSILGLATIFYCLRFETSFFVASYDSQGNGGSIRPRLQVQVQVTLRLTCDFHISNSHAAGIEVTMSYSSSVLLRCHGITFVTIRCWGNKCLPSRRLANDHIRFC
jgi:hypothetical protein